MGRATTRPRDRLRACRTRVTVLIVHAKLLAVGPAAAHTGPAQVERVIDGDTIRVRMDGARSTVRVTGVDTPETKHPTLGVQPFGPEVSAYTTARLTGATVRLDLDPAGDASDTDGRLLRDVMLPGGEHVNATSSAKSAPRLFGRSPTPGNVSVCSSKPRRDGARHGRWAD